MKKIVSACMAAFCLVITACSNVQQSTNEAAIAKHKINFQLPQSQQWDLVSVEQDTNGYAKSYRSVKSQGVAADQSFYINFGRGIKTPLLDSMHEVVGSMASTGCEHINSKMVSMEGNTLIFTADANKCSSGRSIWQVFKVFNMNDGQYAIVYSANPKTVSAKTIAEMKSVVVSAKIGTI